ncbi:MAG TPA: hypothetical protein VFZ53_20190 [Polyangiaceae bacterium]
MNRRPGAWWTLLGSALVLGACIDSNDSLVGEVEPDGGTSGTSGSSNGGSGNGGGATGGTAGAGGCTPGSTRPASVGSCNTCTCQDDQRWICTRTACPECAPGETRSPDSCNTCSCVDGFWNCTERVCADCEPGTIIPRPDGCNTCTCDDTGSFRCTERECGECPAPEEPVACTVPYFYIRAHETERCCFYPEPCTAPVLADDSAYSSYAECMAGPSDYGRRGNCDGDPFSGYETDLMTDPKNCGFCGYECVNLENRAVGCVGGECVTM